MVAMMQLHRPLNTPGDVAVFNVIGATVERDAVSDLVRRVDGRGINGQARHMVVDHDRQLCGIAAFTQAVHDDQ